MLSQSVNFTKPNSTGFKYYKTLNKPIKVNKSHTIHDTNELVIKDVYIQPNIKEEFFVRTLYRFRPVCLKSPKNSKQMKQGSISLPTIKVDRPFSSDFKFKKINLLDKVLVLL
jgi:hypothetical protein